MPDTQEEPWPRYDARKDAREGKKDTVRGRSIREYASLGYASGMSDAHPRTSASILPSVMPLFSQAFFPSSNVLELNAETVVLSVDAGSLSHQHQLEHRHPCCVILSALPYLLVGKKIFRLTIFTPDAFKFFR